MFIQEEVSLVEIYDLRGLEKPSAVYLIPISEQFQVLQTPHHWVAWRAKVVMIEEVILEAPRWLAADTTARR
jgi:hypothetical protein